MTKKNKNKNKKMKHLYIPFGQSEFGMEEMFAQGASALDVAAIMAIRKGDIDSLIRIGAEYTAMGSAVAGIETSPLEQVKLGFGFCMEREVEDVRRECDCEDDD